ncbi:MAG: rhodanese-like domain-containing protein [Candidatus Thermoplasmatota archaeon]|nr:rhodanese-like domain-containing protein [Candidatus Thermoplasmatota archaeon]
MDHKKRSSIAVESDVKVVFDWSMEKLDSKTTSKHVQKLLESTHNDSWSKLVEKAQKAKLVCEKHNLPYVTICVDCDKPMCPKCDVTSHIEMGHRVNRFCRKHEVGYNTVCLLCESEKWTDVVNVPFIKPVGLKEKLEKDAEKLVLIDTRGDSEWDEGHLPNSNHIKWSDFRYERSEGYDELKELVKQNHGKQFILISQGYPKREKNEVKGSARGFLAAVELKTFHGIEDVFVLDGGWTAFHALYPDIVKGHKQNGMCRICDFYNRS